MYRAIDRQNISEFTGRLKKLNDEWNVISTKPLSQQTFSERNNYYQISYQFIELVESLVKFEFDYPGSTDAFVNFDKLRNGMVHGYRYMNPQYLRELLSFLFVEKNWYGYQIANAYNFPNPPFNFGECPHFARSKEYAENGNPNREYNIQDRVEHVLDYIDILHDYYYRYDMPQHYLRGLMYNLLRAHEAFAAYTSLHAIARRDSRNSGVVIQGCRITSNLKVAIKEDRNDLAHGRAREQSVDEIFAMKNLLIRLRPKILAARAELRFHNIMTNSNISRIPTLRR